MPVLIFERGREGQRVAPCAAMSYSLIDGGPRVLNTFTTKSSGAQNSALESKRLMPFQIEVTCWEYLNE